MLKKKSKIDPQVRAKLEELRVDTVRSKLVWIMNVRSLAQQDDLEPLGDGVSASRRQIQEWLNEKTARESRWLRVGVIAGVVGMIAGVLAAVFAFLAWRFPFS
jgi:hypothetical protein